MAAKKLDQYTGTLNPAQIAAGMNAALQNARRLADDATLLLDNKRHCSATALAILSIEESGKLSILRMLASADSADQAKGIWREYRSHTKKNVMGAFLDLFIQGARRLDHFAPLFDQAAEHPHLIDQIKQLALYSDCLGDAHWSEPQEVIDESLARSMVLMASLLSKDKEVLSIEIELWVRYVAPHLHGNRETAERSLEMWYAEMQRRGLAPEGRNAMAQFVNEGVTGVENAEERHAEPGAASDGGGV
jgi:AbiV family abortive infection protein